jgi:hypothetical protein
MLSLIFCACLFLSVWIAVSHIAKKNLLEMLFSINDDNIQISYSDVEVSGFPWKFTISLKRPIIRVINSHQVKSLIFTNIDMNLDLLMQKPYFAIGSKYILQKHGADMSLQSEKKIISPSPNIITIELTNSFLKSFDKRNLLKNLQSLKSQIDYFEIFEGEKAIAKLENLSFDVSKIFIPEDNLKFNTKIHITYSDIANQNSTNLDMNLDFLRYIAPSKEEKSHIKEVDIKNFTIKTQNASAEMKGEVAFPRQKHMSGKLDINLENYPALVLMLTNGGIKSEKFFYKILTEATLSESDNNRDLAKYAKFSIKFTEDNIYFGNIEMNHLIMDALKNE